MKNIFKYYIRYFIELIFLFFIFISILTIYIEIKNVNLNLNNNYLNILNYLNISFNNKIKNKIKIGIFAFGLKNGGRARITSLLLKYLIKIKIFDMHLFTQKIKEIDEYINPENIKRILINNYKITNLIKENKKKRIDILIYQLSNSSDIQILNKLKTIKIIFYLHQSLFYWIYSNYFIFKSLYKEYQKSKYLVCLVPFENDYLFNKWGISSVLINNFVTFEYNKVIPSNLSSKIILMIGRGADKYKRFKLGIQSMEYISEVIIKSEMKIVSDIQYIEPLLELMYNLNLEKKIKFVGFTLTPEIFFKNASLHIFPTLSESFGLVMSETKIYGIPNILVGLDYVSIAKGGTSIIYDDTPESIAKEVIKVFKYDIFKKKLGKEARNSMKKFKNDILSNKWAKLILTIYNDNNNYYEKFRRQSEKKDEDNTLKILERQIKILKMRNILFENITINNIGNFSFLEEININ